jgi:hypothetical protein
MNLSANNKVTRLTSDGTNYSNTASTGDTLNGTVVDMAGFDSVTFIVAVGAITGAGTAACTVQQGAASNLSDAKALTGATHTFSSSTDSNKCAVIEVNRPTDRYVRLSIVRGGSANSVIDSVVAIQSNARSVPVTNGATVDGTVCVTSPAEEA